MADGFTFATRGTVKSEQRPLRRVHATGRHGRLEGAQVAPLTTVRKTSGGENDRHPPPTAPAFACEQQARWNLLQQAVLQHNRPMILQLLMGHSCDTHTDNAAQLANLVQQHDANGNTLLHLLAKTQRPNQHTVDIATALIYAGAAADARNGNHDTPLHLAVRCDPAVVLCTFLLAQAFKTEHRTNCAGETVLYVAAATAHDGQILVLLANPQMRKDINTLTEAKDSALAVRLRGETANPFTVLPLVEAKADLDWARKDANGVVTESILSLLLYAHDISLWFTLLEVKQNEAHLRLQRYMHLHAVIKPVTTKCCDHCACCSNQCTCTMCPRTDATHCAKCKSPCCAKCGKHCAKGQHGPCCDGTCSDCQQSSAKSVSNVCPTCSANPWKINQEIVDGYYPNSTIKYHDVFHCVFKCEPPTDCCAINGPPC
jgi:hypothetical protein